MDSSIPQQSNSPEFEFWNLGRNNPSQQNLISADELFVDGVILPLHKIIPKIPPDYTEPEQQQQQQKSDPERDEPGPQITKSTVTDSTSSASKRWKDIFKKSDKKEINNINNINNKEKKKEKKSSAVSSSSSSASELNINIWPFRRSRSAGNNVTRPRLANPTRNVSSAPCSRSNSSGESKLLSRRQWPSSPGRGGVHLGRSSPVWQAKRVGTSSGSGLIRSTTNFSEPQIRINSKTSKKREVTATNRRSKTVNSGGGDKTKGLNLNVPMCIGYRHHLSCSSSDENIGAIGGIAGNSRVSGWSTVSGGGGIGGHGNVGSLFTLRNLFTKKVY
ncbi:hypothetical protein ACFE04_001808 [Oxalis oulophora]